MTTGPALPGQDLQDVSLYLQGLLQVMAADGHLHDTQRQAVLAYARRSGFSIHFVDNAINSVLKNEHFPSVPPRFNSQRTALEFLREAARIAVCDGLLHPKEQAWLMEAAVRNSLEPGVVLDILDGVPLSESHPTSGGNQAG